MQFPDSGKRIQLFRHICVILLTGSRFFNFKIESGRLML